MITPDGWFDWCERVPGPADKVYSTPNTASIFLPHSAVGYYQGWLGRLFSTARLPNGQYTPYAAASVHLWFPQSPTVPPKQHYSIFKSCWASGSQYPNLNGVAAENEGGPPGDVSQPLTAYQIGLNTRAINDLSAFRGWQPRRPTSNTDKTATLYEHRECTRFGSDPTACPSGRIPWPVIMAGLEQEDDVTQDEFNKMAETWVQSQTGLTIAQLKTAMVDGDAANAKKVDDHAATPHSGSGGGTADLKRGDSVVLT